MPPPASRPAENDTIAAIATAPGEAGIAVIRVSGPDAPALADTLFRAPGPPPSARPPQSFAVGHVIDPHGRPLDEALCLLMRAPRSYTGEHVVEFQCHGGPATSRAVLRRVLDAGARLAEPGEFTRRAFLHGRLDLLQAEAVLDLIQARSDRSAAAALEQLEGALSQRFDTLYEGLLTLAADLEATLDFPEEDLPPHLLDHLTDRLQEERQAFHTLLHTWDEGRLLREGALAVISGCPNAGKSTLLNALLGHDRAIVSPSPGTTRDSIEESLLLHGIPLRLIDTAGLREADCDIERAGISRSRAHIARADLHIRILDASRPLDPEDRRFLDQHDPRTALLLLNKADLPPAITPDDLPGWTALPACLLRHEGLNACRDWMHQTLTADLAPSPEPQAVISERHRRLLVDALQHIDAASEMLLSHREDLIPPAASRLREGLESLGTATGKLYEQELLNSIFSRFCIGK